MRRLIAPLHFPLVTLKRQVQYNSDWEVISCKRVNLGPVLPLNINMILCVENSMASSHLTLVDFERSMSRSLTHCLVGDQIHIFVANINLDIT